MYGCLHYRAELSARTALRGRYYVYPLQRLSAIAIKRRYYYYYYYYYYQPTLIKYLKNIDGFRFASQEAFSQCRPSWPTWNCRVPFISESILFGFQSRIIVIADLQHYVSVCRR